MGTRIVSASSQTDFADAFQNVLADYPPTSTVPVDYRVLAWRAQAGGVVGPPVFSVDVEVSGRDIG
jgi:hypothetical protein